MHAWWTPTSAGYFDHVSKAKTLEAVQDYAPGEVNRLGKLKKAQIASEAERLSAGPGWLPAMFRAREIAAVEPPKRTPRRKQTPKRRKASTRHVCRARFDFRNTQSSAP